MGSAAEHFERHAARLALLYEQTAFNRVHSHILQHLPRPGAEVLDVGSGSGRDAAALAQLGYRVTAVEPSGSLHEMAKRLHPIHTVSWIRDGLPRLCSLGERNFDFLILSAVWMFIPEEDRNAAALRLAELTRPGGKIALLVRELGQEEPGAFQSRDINQVITIFEQHGLSQIACYEDEDTLGRDGRNWTTLVLAKL